MLVATVLLLTLTRTQVGRDFLRDQIISWFNQTYEGELSFHRIRGNILGYLYIEDLELRDPSGQLVLRVDSLLLRPNWYALLLRTLSFDAISLHRPYLFLRRDSTTWNILRALHPRHPPSARRTSPIRAFISGDIRITEGYIETQNAYTLPPMVARGYVFDYTNTRVEHLDLTGTLEWRRDFRFFDLLSLRLHLSEPNFTLTDLQAQLLQSPHKLELPRVQWKSTHSSFSLSAGLSHPTALIWHPDTLRHAQFYLDWEADTLNFDELHALLPTLPLHDGLGLTLKVAGPLSQAEIADLTIRHRGLQLQGTGMLQHLPDSLTAILTFPELTAIPRVLSSLKPSVSIWKRVTALDTLRGTLRTRLDVTWQGTYRLHATGTFEHGASALSGEIQLMHLKNQPVLLHAVGELMRFDPSLWLALDWLPASLNGSFQLEHIGSPLSHLQLMVALENSTLYRRPVDALDFSLDLRGSELQASLRAFYHGGLLRGVLQRREAEYTLSMDMDRLNIGPWLASKEIRTSLSAHLTSTFRIPEKERLRGSLTLQMDSSWVESAFFRHFVPPSTTNIRLSGPPGKARLTLHGTLIEGVAEGTVDILPLQYTLAYWIQTARTVYGQEQQKKRLHATDTLSTLPSPVGKSTLRKVLARYLSSDALTLQGRWTLKEPHLITWLLPSLPPLEQVAPLQAVLQVYASPDSLQTTGDLTISHWQTEPFSGSDLRLHLDMAHRYTDEAPRSTVELHLQADSLVFQRQTVYTPEVHLRYNGGEGTLTASLPRIGSEQSFHLDTDIIHHPDRFRLTLRAFALGIKQRLWIPEGTPTVDLYVDGVVLHDLQFIELQQAQKATPTGATVYLDGTFSAYPSDSARVLVRKLQLADISSLLNLSRPIGGTLQAQAHILHALELPEATGLLKVEDLTYGRYHLGHLNIQSTYFSAIQALRLQTHLFQPLSTEDPTVVPNDLEIEGIIRLYRRDHTGKMTDPGLLNLHVKARKVHLFFFEYLFPNLITDVDGVATGRGQIRGTFSYPVFEASITLPEARFRIPDFNLDYTARGTVTVDSTGFHLTPLELTDPTTGTAAVRGDILFNNYRYFSFDLRGDLNTFQMMNVSQSFQLPFYGHIWLSGEVSLTGPVYQTLLRSPNLLATESSEVFIPVTPEGLETEKGFIVFVDSTGKPLEKLLQPQEATILSGRPPTQRSFLEGMDMTLNLQAPEGATVHLVFDPLLGDMISARGSGRVQLERTEGTFRLFGTFTVSEGHYLFTAGEVFTRRFELLSGGTIVWDGDPLNPQMNIEAAYRTWASLAGLPGQNPDQRVPLIVLLQISGRLETPTFQLRLQLDRGRLPNLTVPAGLESLMNEPDRATEYAVSVLLTNTFLLTTQTLTTELGRSVNELAFNSLSQLIAAQLNRFVNQILSNVEINLGVQQGATLSDLGLTYGIALRLMNERLIIRGQGFVQTGRERSITQELQGEFVVEVRLSEHVSLEVFYRREAELAGYTTTGSTLYGAYGTRLIYETSFANWKVFVKRILPLHHSNEIRTF